MVTLPTGPTISCPLLHSPVAVIATYAGLPVAGATVTIFYVDAGGVTRYESVTTNDVGLAQACVKDWLFVEARIQKTGINFGSGVGLQHKIGTKSGLDRLWNPTFLIIALPCDLPQIYNPITSKCESLPCMGSISIPKPDWTSLLSGPTLPGTIPVPFTITAASGASLPSSIPLIINIDDRKATSMTGTPGTNSIDILAIIRTFLGAAAFIDDHRLSIVADLPDCKIPVAGLDIPPLVPKEILCKVWETVANVTVPSVLQPFSAIFVSGANYVCKDFVKTEPVNATALVRIGSRIFNIEIRNGTGFLTLTKSDIAKLVG